LLGAPHPFQSFNVFLGDFAPNTTGNFFPNVAVDATLKKLAVEIDPRQWLLTFVASAVRHVARLYLVAYTIHLSFPKIPSGDFDVLSQQTNHCIHRRD